MAVDTWATQELVFVLDLYLTKGDLHRGRPEVIAASETLRSIALAKGEKAENFRSPSSVASKLANFRAVDTGRESGRPNGGRNDRLVWERFHNKPAVVAQVAAAMKALADGLDESR